MYLKAAIAITAITTLTACTNMISPKDFESTPVLADSPMGPVTCQIYTREQVTWDRSIGRPANMDVNTADNLCRAEGQRIMNGGTPNYAPTISADPVLVVEGL
ncbi:MAG: hypothetical protein ACK5LJ_13170 [Paracoccus sp. (in: a-proteobacteria)]